jgi:hypothetical protein
MYKSFIFFCLSVLLILSVFSLPSFSVPFSPPVPEQDKYQDRIYTIAMYGIKNGQKQWFYSSTDSLYYFNFGKGGAGQVTFYVGVPKYCKDNKYQVLFVRTSYSDRQPVALMKNGPTPCFFPFFQSHDYIWEKYLSVSNMQKTRDDYLSYHWDKKEYKGKNRKIFNLWHNNSSWNLNCKNGTYDFVHKIMVRPLGSFPATERMIRMVKYRNNLSWAKITSIPPARGDSLRVMVSFSGEESDEPSFYDYIFVNDASGASVNVR